jgi:hypothetical protein
MAKTFIKLGKNARTCEGCTKCCDGWLAAKIEDQQLQPGSPCKYVDCGVGCTIYNDRPEEVCSTFQCGWKDGEVVPEQFSPKEIGQIITVQQLEEMEYILVAYAGKEIASDFLSWLVTFAVARQLNVEWSVNGQPHMLGSQTFIEARHRQLALLEKEHLQREKDKKKGT